MPTAVNTALLAMEFDNEPRFASQTVFYTTILSVVTVSFTIYLGSILFAN
jgi:predicted permease